MSISAINNVPVYSISARFNTLANHSPFALECVKEMTHVWGRVLA